VDYYLATVKERTEPTMAIHKIVVAVTVLVEADTLDKAAREVEDVSLAELASEITDGGWIGQYQIVSSETVAPKNVKYELLNIGNDGEFFDREDFSDDAEEPDEK
jgi:hypothetical protein